MCFAVVAVLAGCVIIPYKRTRRVTYTPSSAETTWAYMESDPHEPIEKMSDAIHKVDSDITVVDPETVLDAAFPGEESRQRLDTETLLDPANCARLREQLRIDFVFLIGAPTVRDQMANAQIADIRQHRQEIIDHAAKEGKTIDTASLRQTMEEIKAKNTGPDRDAIAADIDRLLQSLEAKYGAEIPIDHAQRIVEDLEAGREVSG